MQLLISQYNWGYSCDVYLISLCIFFADRTSQRLEITLEVAEGTLNRSAEVLQTVTPITSKVEKWASNMRNNEYSTDAYKKAVLSARVAGIINTVHQRLKI